MLGAQLGQALTLPTRSGGLPGWPNGLARAPRARAPRGNLVRVGLGFPLGRAPYGHVPGHWADLGDPQVGWVGLGLALVGRLAQ